MRSKITDAMVAMRMYVLDLGTMRMDRSLFFRNWRLASRAEPEPRGAMMEFPISAYYIDHPDGRVLYDTGCNPEAMGPGGRWSPFVQEHFAHSGTPECELPARLEQLGIGPDDIRYVVLSHMHNDHAGCVEFFRNSTLIVHEDEFSAALRDYATGARDSPYTWADTDHWIRLGLDWHLLGREQRQMTLNDRVTIHNWGSGHSYGMLGLEVDLRGQPGVILTSDAVYCSGNYEPPVQLPTVMHDSLGYRGTLERVRELSRRTRRQVWFGHDAEQFAGLRKSTDGWYE